MCSTVLFKDRVVEVFDAERNPRDADLFQRFDFLQTERSRLTLKRDFFSRFPRDMFGEFVAQKQQLSGTQVRRRSTTKIDKSQIAILHRFGLAEHLDFAGQAVDVTLNRLRILIGINAEVTEAAAFSAEWNVKVKPHRNGRVRW